ncbi:hypothetical protein C8R44DRAFT_221934 [Mycena epipterygia]|nr:hypothetical protein C8R44DRAFT_221934 [Mycena epipterygia]
MLDHISYPISIASDYLSPHRKLYLYCVPYCALAISFHLTHTHILRIPHTSTYTPRHVCVHDHPAASLPILHVVHVYSRRLALLPFLSFLTSLSHLHLAPPCVHLYISSRLVSTTLDSVHLVFFCPWVVYIMWFWLFGRRERGHGRGWVEG